MQGQILILPRLTALNLLKDVGKVEAINYSPDSESLFTRFNSFNKFYNSRKTKNDLVRYIPGLVKLTH